MTIKEKKEFLKKYQQINNEIDRLLSERERYFALATKITTTYSDKPQSHSNNSKIEEAIEKITMLENKMNEEIFKLTLQREKIEKAISTVNNKTLEELLKRRYINCETWEVIAVNMNYCWQYVHELHSKALKAIEYDTNMC